GIQLGTRFIATVESEGADWVKQRLLKTEETGTMVSSLMTGKPVRAFATRILREYEQALTGADSTEEQGSLRAQYLNELRYAPVEETHDGGGRNCRNDPRYPHRARDYRGDYQRRRGDRGKALSREPRGRRE